MPQEINYQEINSEEVQEIITAIPKWIVRWGITLILAVLGTIIFLSALIQYPDVVRVNLKVNSLNSPKQVLAKKSGKLIKLLVKDGQIVKENQLLAFFETTANPKDVLILALTLKKIKANLLMKNETFLDLPIGLNLGELQTNYQNFYLQLLQYQSTQKDGYYLSRMAFLENDLNNIKILRKQILKQQMTQQQEYNNQEEEYKSYQQLYRNKVISRNEFVHQENKFLASKYPLQQTETSILNNASSYSTKEKELLDLKHTIAEQQGKFGQAISQCINEIDTWILQYVLRAPIDGKLSFAGIVQESQNVIANQELFVVNPGNTDFFGEVQIPQYNMGKIELGERTLIKLRSYPFEQYGMIRGKLTYVSEVAFQDSLFIAKISFEHFENKDAKRKIVLKNGMQGEAEIITEESSLLQRFLRNLTKIIQIN